MASTGLVKVAVSQRDNKTWNKTILLRTNSILDMEDNSNLKAVFWCELDNASDMKRPASKLVCSSYSVNNLTWAILIADPTNDRFWVNVLYETKQHGTRVVKDKMVKLYTDQILYAYDNPDGTTSTMYIKRGNDIYKWILSHTLDDIIRAASKSASLSRSPL